MTITVDSVVREVLVSSSGVPGPIPVFPTLPQGFPVVVSPNLQTTVGEIKSLREMRAPVRTYPLWNIELKFEELRDQTQNQTIYGPLAGYTDYISLVQTFLSMYGKYGVFALDAPWDDSRSAQAQGLGDGATYIYTAYRTWGSGGYSFTEPVGYINTITSITVGGVTVPATNYYASRNKMVFADASGIAHPPGNGSAIAMTFSYYYLCRFDTDELQLAEFMKNRYEVPSLKLQSVYWP